MTFRWPFFRIDISEGMDVSETIVSKDCIICHYWYFLGKGFRFHLPVCNGCHDVSVFSSDINNITVLNIHGADYVLLSLE